MRDWWTSFFTNKGEQVKDFLEQPVENNPVDRAIIEKLPGTDNEQVNEVYQARWVWYHTILALELFFTNVFLFILIIVNLVK